MMRWDDFLANFSCSDVPLLTSHGALVGGIIVLLKHRPLFLMYCNEEKIPFGILVWYLPQTQKLQSRVWYVVLLLVHGREYHIVIKQYNT